MIRIYVYDIDSHELKDDLFLILDASVGYTFSFNTSDVIDQMAGRQTKTIIIRFILNSPQEIECRLDQDYMRSLYVEILLLLRSRSILTNNDRFVNVSLRDNKQGTFKDVAELWH